MQFGDRYRLDALLEQGRFGTMYRGVDLERGASGRGREVGIWLLPPELAKNGPALAAFRHDIERLRDLSHPRIASVIDVEQIGDRLVVTTEFPDGETLRDVLDALGTETLTQSEADMIVDALGAALIHAHAHGIVHGDVRAENVVITVEHDVKLANFMLGSVARSAPFASTPGDDVRGLAAIAHELYCGAAPNASSLATSLKRAPKRRRKALANVLAKRTGSDPSVDRFLAEAGLASHAGRGPGGRVAAARTREARSWLSRRVAYPLLAIAAISAAIYAADELGWREPVLDSLRSAARAATEAANREAAAPNASGTRDPAAVAIGRSADSATRDLAGRPAGATSSDATPRQAEPKPEPETLQTEAPRATQPAQKQPGRDERAANPPETRSIAALTSVAFTAHTLTVHEYQGLARVGLVRTGDLSTPADAVWWTSDGTARAADDYASFGRRVETFAAGERTRTLYIPIADDAVAEQPESFFVHVDSGAQPGLGTNTSTAEVRILDDDL